ncbi:DNA repair protein RecO [Mycoplasma sp. 773]
MVNREFETEGIVLEIINHGDNDAIIQALTQSGVCYFFAKGIQNVESKNRRNLLLLGLSNFELIRSKFIGNMPRLKRATLVSFFPLQETLQDIFNKVHYFLKRAGKQNNNFLYARYRVFLENVEKKPNHSFIYILLAFLDMFGYRQNLSSCVECGDKEHIVDFEFYKGGFLCRNHSQKSKDINLLRGLYWIEADFEYFKSNIDEIDVIQIINMVISFMKTMI